MSPYAILLAATIAANVALLAVAGVTIRRRRTRLTFAGFLASFAGAHGIALASELGALDPAWQGLGFAALVLGYASLALFVLLFLRGTSRQPIPLVLLVLVPAAALVIAGVLGNWNPAGTFQPTTEPVPVAVNAYLVLCLGVAVAECVAAWRPSSGQARQAFPLLLGAIALVIAGPIYGFELVVVGVTSFTGTNLGAPLAGAFFLLGMAQANPLPFRGRATEGPRRVPWMVPGGAYLIEEARPKCAEALFLAASYESPALAILSEPASSAPDLAGIETVRLPPGPRGPAVLAATAAEFLARHPTGAVLVDDTSYAVANGGLLATVHGIGRVASGLPPTGRLVVSLSKLTAEERGAFAALPGTHLAPPDVESQLVAILHRRLGAAGDPLARAAVARGKRVEDLSIVDVPHVRDYLIASLADLRGPADEVAQSGWRSVSEGLASDLEALWRTAPMDARSEAQNAPNTSEADVSVVRAADVLAAPTDGPKEEPMSIRPPLGTAVRDAFLGSLGPAGEPVYRRVLHRLRKEPSALGPEDLPRVVTLAEEALRDLFSAIDVDDAKRDLAARTNRLRTELRGLARGDR